MTQIDLQTCIYVAVTGDLALAPPRFFWGTERICVVRIQAPDYSS